MMGQYVWDACCASTDGPVFSPAYYARHGSTTSTGDKVGCGSINLA